MARPAVVSAAGAVDAAPVMATSITRFALRSGALVCVVAFAALTPSYAGASITASNWDAREQAALVRAGVMHDVGTGFGGSLPLTAGQANEAMAAISPMLADATAAGLQQPPTEATAPAAGALWAEPTPPTELPSASEIAASERSSPATESVPAPVAHTKQSPVTVVAFDSMLTDELGLSEVAAHVQAVAAQAGLRPPWYFGSEVTVRFLELAYEHPVGTQRFDLFPQSPITRAAAAWSLSAALKLSSWTVTDARQSLESFALPSMSAAERQALSIAVSRIGYPYVWGGTTDNTADGLEHGGFDCSGFAWRVYKVSGLPWGREILGRTAAEQGGEIPRSQRLRAGQLQPGDLLFFGSAHFNSRATNQTVIHEGIYLGDNWVIHSSGQGVYVLPLHGSWLGDQFAWGRRVID